MEHNEVRIIQALSSGDKKARWEKIIRFVAWLAREQHVVAAQKAEELQREVDAR